MPLLVVDAARRLGRIMVTPAQYWAGRRGGSAARMPGGAEEPETTPQYGPG
jgi:hypothetical protein